MACNGVHTQDLSTGTTTCSNHRAECPTNRPFASSADFGVQGGLIRASDIELLRQNIRAELETYNLHANYDFPLYQATAIASGAAIDNTEINNLEQMAFEGNGASGGVQPQPAQASYADASLIDDLNWNSLLQKYNYLRQDCVCNSDCSCNAVCACHNDCGCHYSDQRLKENIQLVGQRNGLNIYTFNYIWDQTTEYVGVIAQEILKTSYAKAVVQTSSGYYMVNYKKLPF